MNKFLHYATMPWLVRTVLVLTFLFAVGLVPMVVETITGESSVTNPDPATDRPRWSEVNNLTAKLATEAKKKGTQYSPSDYFRDLVAIHNKKKRLGLHYGGAMFENMIAKNEMLSLMQENLRASRFDQKSLEVARDRFDQVTDPERYANDKALRARPLSSNLGVIGVWIFLLYLKLLPFALTLYLLWTKEEAEDWGKESKVRPMHLLCNPLSFVTALLAYPIFIGRIWYMTFSETGRRIWGEAEVRRAKTDLFRLLSEDEVGLVKRFVARQISRTQLREEVARHEPASHHGIAIALAATMLLLAAAAFAPARERHLGTQNARVEICSCDSQSRDGPQLNSGGKVAPDNSPADLPAVPLADPVWSAQRIVPETTSVVTRPPREAEHIPISSVVGLIFNN